MLNPLLGPQSLAGSYQSTIDSINTNPITGANLIGTDNTEYGIVTDNTALLLAAKYSWDPFKFFIGYEHIQQFNPTNPLGVGASAQGGYLLSGVTTSVFPRPARPRASARPAQAFSTSFHFMRIITSPNVSTSTPVSRIPRSAAVLPLPSRTARACPMFTTTTWLRPWGLASPSERLV